MTIDEVIRNYVETRPAPVVSTANAVRSIKSVLPNCPLDDRELAELIAQHAVREGLVVNFD
ncbi:hypothetical protein GRZ55_16380 [Chelativorans sp. ZYF759]|uniref:hypothetical protein n=1 Tax=Chelativorans sp. ZYF759 TaxID=2692213 RepID=UPI00145C86F3|nr:hypothetical protein [Chelativorans sp. ZYF759]NMG40825.1 hypothetical protein [Chelativorans sp. ZYF759]